MPEEKDQHPADQRADKPRFLTQTRFTDFDIPETVQKGITDAGFIFCSPIQAQVLPISLSGKDVAGQAQTGTGKTAAFLITLFSLLGSVSKRRTRLPVALIVSPTRELAYQIYDEAQVLGKYTGMRIARVVGGVEYQKQGNLLKKGVEVVVGTPGRIIDYYKQGIFKTPAVKLVVVDEADRLLDMGFAKDMRYILSKLPSYEKRQSMLFSATLSYRVMELTYEYMNLPEFIAVAPEEVTVEGIEQSLYHVGMDNKLPLLLGLLTQEKWRRVLIFVNTKSGVEWLTLKLKGNGWAAEGITGDLPQRKRFELMERFKNDKLSILVATDVASRGIHIEDITHVINYDLPQDAENYVHRIGRTARAGKSGKALSLACEKYVYHLEALETLLGYKIPVEWPDDGMLVEDRCGKVTTRREMRKVKSQRRSARGRGKTPYRGKAGTPKSGRKTFPGAIFGFGPQPERKHQIDPERDNPTAPGPNAGGNHF